MKRSAALAPLSRDHHHALDVARRLRRAGAGDAAAAVDRFLAFWSTDGQRHFAIEEAEVLPALGDDDPEWAAAVEQVRRDHAAIRDMAAALASESGDPPLELVVTLGNRLNDHVRFEERHMFTLLEAGLSRPSLDRLRERVLAAERSAARPGD